MPKATKQSRSHVTREDPISKPTKSTSTKARTGRDSHLYTDDNPKTTIHGTGFKDKAAADRTLKLIADRSLIYQWQTVNTMFNRAKYHPSMKKAAEGSAGTADMRAAMEVFREWLDVTYPAAQAALRGGGGFKPLLSKKVVERHLEQIKASEVVSEIGKQFSEVYCHLPKGKKLGNVLVDDSKPMEPDWERRRYIELDQLVPSGEGKEDGQDAWKISELWTEDRVLSEKHLELIAWAWSPVPEKKLP